MYSLHFAICGIVLITVRSTLAATTYKPDSQEATTIVSVSQEVETTTNVPVKQEKADISSDIPNQERFRQALSQEQQQNCLQQLLCGVRNSNPPNKKSNYVNDLAFVVKEFFDLVDIGDSGGEQDDVDDEKKDEEKSKTKDENKAKSPHYKITNLSTKKKIVNDNQDDDEAEDDPVGSSEISSLSKMKQDSIKRITLEELVDDIRLIPEDLVKYTSNRRGRAMSARASQDLKIKMGRMKHETDDKKKLSIAADIANRFRTPRQCRQLSLTSNPKSVCPLTREVIKYLQTNIAKGDEKRRNETALATLNYAAQQGFLLVEGDKGETHVVDHSPIVANTHIATDLKNPSVPTRFAAPTAPPEPPVKESEKGGSSGEDEDAEEEDEDEDAEADTDDEASGGDGEADEEEEDEEEDEEDDEERRRNLQKQEEKKKLPMYKKSPPTVSPGAGTISVYGRPQSSFDNDFTKVAATIGTSVKLFDQDDYDSVLMSGYPVDKFPKSYQKEKKKPAAIVTHARSSSNSKRYKKKKAAPASDSVEDEEPTVEESQQVVIKASAQKQPSYFQNLFFGGGRPQQQEHAWSPPENNRPSFEPRPLPSNNYENRYPAFRPSRSGFGRPARYFPMPFYPGRY